MAAALLHYRQPMPPPPSSSAGFTLLELMLVVAVGGTLMAMSIPIFNGVTKAAKLNEGAHTVERVLQSARLAAVNSNRALRVRFNCPQAGMIRIVEVLGTSADAPVARCGLSSYPYPAADLDLMTRPNHDGPIQVLSAGVTVTSSSLQFETDGSISNASSGTPVPISPLVTITVTRLGQFREITVNGAGKIELR